jgi:hypothetical protein
LARKALSGTPLRFLVPTPFRILPRLLHFLFSTPTFPTPVLLTSPAYIHRPPPSYPFSPSSPYSFIPFTSLPTLIHLSSYPLPLYSHSITSCHCYPFCRLSTYFSSTSLPLPYSPTASGGVLQRGSDFALFYLLVSTSCVSPLYPLWLSDWFQVAILPASLP